MGDRRRVHTSDGDIVEVELVVPRNYKYDDEDRNDFIHGFGVGTVSDREIALAIRKGWARRV